MPVFQLSEQIVFPQPDLAHESGLLAIGGDLSPERLLLAYQMGIFPWFDEESPIMWHAPDPRCVLYPKDFKIRKSLKKAIQGRAFTIYFDKDFEHVIRYCAEVPRKGQAGTWITEEMISAYNKLHKLGHSHCISCYQEDQLVGGLYGIQVGNVFCGESMFSLVSEASKICFAALIGSFAWEIIDCQVYNEHLGSLGAVEIERASFNSILGRQKLAPKNWTETAVEFGGEK